MTVTDDEPTANRLLHPPDHDTCVLTAESERAGEHRRDGHPLSMVWNIVQVAIGVRILIIDGGRDEAFPDAYSKVIVVCATDS